MADFLTHDLFGDMVRKEAPVEVRELAGQYPEAYRWGLQGPDILFFRSLWKEGGPFHHAAGRMHGENTDGLFSAMTEHIRRQEGEKQKVLLSYFYGFLCHYALDSTAHPLVYFHEYRLCDAGEPGLSRADGSEVHSLIESELDELTLFTRRGQTVATFDPSAEILKASDFVLHVVSKLYAYLALTVYGEIVPERLFTIAMKDFRAAQRFFHSPSGRKRALVGRLEQLARPFSFYRSMSHRPVELAESAFDNRARDVWENPFTGETRTASFQDLYDEALEKAQASIASFDRDGFDLEAARAITNDLDFSGRPVVAVLVAVEDDAPARA